MLEDAVRMPSFFCFFIMSFSIQVSIAKRSRHRIGQNKKHIVLTTHISQTVACGHVQLLYSSAKLHTRSYRQVLIKHNKYSYATYIPVCLSISSPFQYICFPKWLQDMQVS